MPDSSGLYERYVAIGDSSTEGLDDPDPAGGYRGWANRLAQHLANANGRVLYANFAVRGRKTKEILADQLEPARALKPDLVTIFSGTNDVIAPRFDLHGVAAAMLRIQSELIASGAVVLTFTLPDLSPVMPLARPVSPRILALNDALRDVAAETGARLVDFARYPVATDPRLWSADRLHANSLGHERIAAALAEAAGVEGAGGDWGDPLPPLLPRDRRAVWAAELSWGCQYLLPWIWRKSRGVSSGDGRLPKQPDLIPVLANPDAVSP